MTGSRSVTRLSGYLRPNSSASWTTGCGASRLLACRCERGLRSSSSTCVASSAIPFLPPSRRPNPASLASFSIRTGRRRTTSKSTITASLDEALRTDPGLTQREDNQGQGRHWRYALAARYHGQTDPEVSGTLHPRRQADRACRLRGHAPSAGGVGQVVENI